MAPGMAGGTGAVPGGGGSDAIAGSGAGGPIVEGSAGATAGGAGGGGGVQPGCAPAPRSPLRRITRFEYNNSVRDLFGVTSNPADEFPGEEAGSGFGNDADALGVSRLLIDGYRQVAQRLGLELTADQSSLEMATRCDMAQGEAQCEQSFLPGYLTRVFRRPPTSDELDAYRAAFATGSTLGGGFASGVRAVIERSLQAPQFLYRLEVGEPVDAECGLAKPTGYELATRLSYLLWSSTPDDELLAAADQGLLATKEGVAEQARRMLEDTRKSKDSLRYFHRLLFTIGGLDYLERDASYYPTYLPGMGKLFRQETETFLDHVIWEGEGDLKTILTAPYTFVNEDLATFYGYEDVTGDDFVQVSLESTPRAGLLTQASILAATTPGSRTNPVERGKWLYTKMLCGNLPNPPFVPPELPELEPGQSVRDRLERHREDDACAGCHALMDPLGLAFEQFDGVGLWRDTDNGAAIDATGNIPITDVAGPFDGVVEFAQKLAQSEDVLDCYVGRYLTYAYGRAVDDGDAVSRGAAEVAFVEAGGNIKDLMLAVTQTDGFLYRELVPAGQ